MTTTESSTFQDLGLPQTLLRALADVGYEAPSPIQARSIPHLLAGKDLFGQAQTGTGKTAAFALPVLSKIDITRREPQALVLTPTRELALQVAEAFQSYARYLEGFHVLPIYGGQGMQTQLRQLARGVHVIVGTPGRICDHLRRKTLNLGGLSMLVLDEADEMLKMGFQEDVEWILDHTPTSRQVALFSATMPPGVRHIAYQHLREPAEIKIQAKTATVEAINQQHWVVSGVSKLEALTRILEVQDIDAMLIFVRTKTETADLAEKLEARGYEAAALHGDMTQAMREKVVERLKKNNLDIVVATDVAARGLDVERISHVVNYDIPYDPEAYIHRIGRTGRAGRTGSAILFVSPRERRMLRVIEQVTRQPIPEMRLPSLRELAEKRIEQFQASLAQTLENEDLSFYRTLITNMLSLEVGSAEDLAAALAFLLHKERPLHVPDAEDPAEHSHQRRDREYRNDDRPQTRNFPDLAVYSIDVGKQHGVLPKDIVGAIANETGLPPRLIGAIRLFDTHSTVELPENLPEEFFRALQNTWVRNQRLNIKFYGAAKESQPRPRRPEGARRPARSGGPRSGGSSFKPRQD